MHATYALSIAPHMPMPCVKDEAKKTPMLLAEVSPGGL